MTFSFQNQIKAKEGVLVGTSKQQEWLLPWWYFHYKAHNNYPICFVDFGVSEEVKLWMQERGTYMPLSIKQDFMKNKDKIDPELIRQWVETGKNDLGYVWGIRHKWFLKPFALLQTIFEKTIWLDTDCQVNCNLDLIFSKMKQDKKILVARDFTKYENDYPKELNDINNNYVTYNSGVVGFYHQNPIIVDWANTTYLDNHKYLGDQDVLAAILRENRDHVLELDKTFNFNPFGTTSAEGKIIHWFGEGGKKRILKNMPEVSFYNFREFMID